MDALTREEMHEVDELLEDIYTGETTEEVAKERFKIKALDGANWAFRKLRAIEIKEAEIKALRDEEIKRIQEWAEQDLNKCKDSKQFFEFLLEEYFREQKALDPKFKISTPYGKVSSRKSQPKWNYDDEKVLESLKESKLDKFIRIKEEVNRADLKKEVTVIEYELGFVCAHDGTVLGEVRLYNSDKDEYVNVETGEVYNIQQECYEIYNQVVVYDGKIINGIKVEPQPESVTIKVEV